LARILLLTHALPYPLNAGAKVRQYHVLRHLSRNYEVTLVSFARPDDAPDAVAHLHGICHAVHTVPMRRSTWRNLRAGVKGLLTGLPMTVVRSEIGQMADTLRRLVRETAYDVVHADQLSMSGYGQLAALAAARMAGPRQPRTLLDEHNAIYVLARRMADTEANWLRRAVMAREARAYARYEAAMCRAYDAVLTVIPEDREHLLALFPDEREEMARKFVVVPICVDPDQTSTVARRDGGPPTVLHLGTMFWPPNIHGVLWFAREVLPLVHQRMPEARFVVVGKNPSPDVQALAADPRVQVTGYVADLAPYLEAADAFVVPLHAGSGMRVKILDAWLWGLPIVSTPIGAEGIEVREEENILLARDAPDFAEAVVRLLTDAALNRRLRSGGRDWVEEKYAWSTVYRQIDKVYGRLLGAGAGGNQE
jgi:glycosyltransferase involved in cell wall biosynthesis